MTALLLLLGACLVLTSLTSLWEGAFQGIPLSRVETIRRRGGIAAFTLARLRERFAETVVALLALDLVGNAGVVVAVVELSDDLAGATGLATLLGDRPAVWTCGVTLLLALFFVGNLLPRSLGFAYAEAVGLRSALVIQTLVRLLWPVVLLGSALGKRLGRRGEQVWPTVDDVLALASFSARAGNLEFREARWIANALKLGDLTVRQVMTPRTVVYALPAELPLSAVRARSQHWEHSRLPIFRERNPDEIVGLVLRRTIFDKLMSGETQGALESLALPVESVPDSMTLDHLLEWFVSKRQHLAIVRDEFQAWVGVVTLEDVLESFLGAEIVDEKDRVIDMRELARKRARESGVKVGPAAPDHA